jgi:hypothetical protein
MRLILCYFEIACSITEMAKYHSFAALKRLQLHAKLMACSQGTNEPKKSKKSLVAKNEADGQTAQARTAIVKLLGAEPAPMPSLDANTALPPATSAATAPHKPAHTPAVRRPDSELIRHALELLEARENLNPTRMSNDCGMRYDCNERV